MHRRKVQRLPEGCGSNAARALDNRQERPAPEASRVVEVAGEEIVHSRRERRGQGNPLGAGSSPARPTNSRPRVCWNCWRLVGADTFRVMAPQMSKIFISHSSANNAAALALG